MCKLLETRKTLQHNEIHLHCLFPQITLQKERQIQILNQSIAQFTQNCVKQDQSFMVISGDHSSAMGTWAGVLNASRSINQFGLLWLDAHLDAHTYHSSPSANCHGMPVSALLGKADPDLNCFYPAFSHIKPSNVILLGARSYEHAELRLLHNLTVKVILAHQIDNFEQAFLSAYHQLSHSCRKLGISLDLDLVDPADAPAVATPVPGGINATELLGALTSIQGHKQWCGLECSEFIPDYDRDNRTLKLLLNIVQIYTARRPQLSKTNKFFGSASSGSI